MATFHSAPFNKLPAFAPAGDLWWANDIGQLFIGLGFEVTPLANLSEILSGTVPSPGAPSLNIAVKATDYETQKNDDVILMGSASPTTVTIDASILSPGKRITVTNTSTGKVTVQPSAGTVNGESNAILFEGDSIDFIFDGANFFVQ